MDRGAGSRRYLELERKGGGPLYVNPAAAGTRAFLYRIPHGHAGIEATVRHMQRLRRAATSDPYVRDAAQRITAGRHGWEAAHRIRRFLADRVPFEFDPWGVELVRTPAYMLHAIADTGASPGDCDDAALLGASLAIAAGLPARYVLVGLTPGEPFEHIYAEILTDRGPVELDTTRPAQFPPGLAIHRTAHREA